MTFEINKPTSKADRIAALKAKVAKPEDAALAKHPTYIPASECFEKIRIIFDDSSSMGHTEMENAKKGIVEFIRNCIPNQTAIAIHFLNLGNKDSQFERKQLALVTPLLQAPTLESNLIKVASAIDNPKLGSYGGTPLFQTLLSTLKSTPQATRLIAFSDGCPDGHKDEDATIALAKELKIPIDTVFLGYSTEGEELMKSIADRTGGIYLHFKEGSSFKSSFKYLAPGQRLMLTDGNFRARVERGEA